MWMVTSLLGIGRKLSNLYNRKDSYTPYGLDLNSFHTNDNVSQHIRPFIYRLSDDGQWVSEPMTTPLEKWTKEIRSFNKANAYNFSDTFLPLSVRTMLSVYSKCENVDFSKVTSQSEDKNTLRVFIGNNFHIIDKIYDELC